MISAAQLTTMVGPLSSPASLGRAKGRRAVVSI
jgi:hypothetical protein